MWPNSSSMWDGRQNSTPLSRRKADSNPWITHTLLPVTKRRCIKITSAGFLGSTNAYVITVADCLGACGCSQKWERGIEKGKRIAYIIWERSVYCKPLKFRFSASIYHRSAVHEMWQWRCTRNSSFCGRKSPALASDFLPWKQLFFNCLTDAKTSWSCHHSEIIVWLTRRFLATKNAASLNATNSRERLTFIEITLHSFTTHRQQNAQLLISCTRSLWRALLVRDWNENNQRHNSNKRAF